MMIPSQLMENSPIPPHAWTRFVAHGATVSTAAATAPTTTHRQLFVIIETSFPGAALAAP